LDLKTLAFGDFHDLCASLVVTGGGLSPAARCGGSGAATIGVSVAALEQFIAPHLRDQSDAVSFRPTHDDQARPVGGLVALVFVALAEPQAGFRWEQVKRRGNDIIFAVDTSRSMTTPDVKPNRLARAKLAIDDFVNRLNGDAVGLVAFAGKRISANPDHPRLRGVS
jgi:hypothetical protein